jgi:ribosome biogenesis protein MAK21
MINRQKKGKLTGDDRMLQTMLRSGTLADKVAAMTLAIQDDPLCHLSHLESLTTLAKKTNQRESAMAIEALKDLYMNNLLPDRKLRRFAQQPYNALEHLTDGLRNRRLILWYFEDCIKNYYAELIGALETAVNDSLLHHKRLGVSLKKNQQYYVFNLVLQVKHGFRIAT